MIPLVTSETALRQLFAALTEHTFQVEIGVADPLLTDYLVEMLMRFSRLDTMDRFRDVEGHRLEQVADMVEEADQRQAQPKRELHRHIGDFTLFWSGLYPESLKRLQSPFNKDHLIDYEEQGKNSYLIASRFEDGPFEEEAAVLRRLSNEYEICREGLKLVRHELDRMPTEPT
jgi:hypothetical protein